MTRLINFGLGETVDRLTIIALKMQHEVGSLAPWQHERSKLIIRIFPHTAETVPEWRDLAKVNNQLWMAEDKMRAYRGSVPRLTLHVLADVGELGMRCQALNDERAQLIASINQSQGDQHAEKRTQNPLPGRL